MSRLAVPLRGIEIFAEAGRTGSFKQAAANLSLTTSAISQAVRKLEDGLGCRLFRRTGNTLRLTREGEMLLGPVDTGLDHVRRGIDAVRAGANRQLSITAPPGIARQLLGPVLRDLLTSEDAADLRFVSDEAPDFRSYREFDIAVLYGERAAALPDVTSLGPDVFTPVCRSSLRPALTDVASLMRLPLVVNETNAVTWTDWAARNGASLRGAKWLRLNRLAQVLPVVLAGEAIALESLRVFAPQLADGSLMPCALPGTMAIRRELTFLYGHPRNHADPVIGDIVARVQAACLTNEDGAIST